MTTALETIREDAALGAAWRRAEAALPEGAYLEGVDVCGKPTHEEQRHWHAFAWNEKGPIESGQGPTPTAALEALAAKLEAL